jgi:hypothetical protein
VLQHSVGDPAVMRRGLALVQAAPAGDVDPAQVAMLEDRVRVHSGLPQRYGTQFDWGADGVLSPRPIEDPDGVEARRRAVGLPPLAETLREVRERAAREGDRAPPDPGGAAPRHRRVGAVGRLARVGRGGSGVAAPTSRVTDAQTGGSTTRTLSRSGRVR